MNLTELRNHPIFICGHPKAGTSLLRALLDSHPQLVVYPEETAFFRRFLPNSRGLDQNKQLELAEQQLIHIFRWNAAAPTPDQEDFPGRDYSQISFEKVRQEMTAIVSNQPRHPGDVLSAAVLAYGLVCGQVGEQSRAWVEKSPYNEYYAGEIFNWWPDARCIHILRDPRDNYASYRRKHPTWSPEFFSLNWIRSTQAGIENEKRYGSDRYLILKYEDLTQLSADTLEKVRLYLDIDWDAAFTSPTRAGGSWRGNSMFANQFQEISSAPVDRWKKHLTPTEAAVIELKTMCFLQQFGYQPSWHTERSPSQKFAAHVRWAVWPAFRLFNRLNKPNA